MSRIHNLVSIRNHLNNTWRSDWYSDYYYDILLFEDLKTRMYLYGIFRRLELPTSLFYLIRNSNNHFFLQGDIYFLENINKNMLRNSFIEVEKYEYFQYLNYYTLYSYYNIKQKRSGYRNVLSLGFNTDSLFKAYFKQDSNVNILKKSDIDKLTIYKLFNYKYDRFKYINKYNILLTSYVNYNKEKYLDIIDKFNHFTELHLLRDIKYSRIQEWSDGWFNEETDSIYIIANKLLFFFLFFLYNRNNTKYFYFLQNEYTKQDVIVYSSNFYYLYKYKMEKFFSLVKKKTLIHYKLNNIVKLFNFDINKKKNAFQFFFYFKYFILYIKILFLIFKNNISKNIIDIISLYRFFLKKYKLYFLSSNNFGYIDLRMDYWKLRRFAYNHKKYLKRIKHFEKLKYRFLNETYRKQYFNSFFYYFIKELEHTIYYYISKNNIMSYNVFISFNVFFKKNKEHPFIKDGKIISDLILLRMYKRFKIHRVFYEIRDWQFKNYYQRQSILSKKENKMDTNYVFFYNEKKSPVLGIRIECSGSYKPGSRKKKNYYGEVVKDVELRQKNPNNSFYADLDYYQSVVKLKSGSIGIKVWVFFKTHIYNKNKHFISIVTSD